MRSKNPRGVKQVKTKSDEPKQARIVNNKLARIRTGKLSKILDVPMDVFYEVWAPFMLQ